MHTDKLHIRMGKQNHTVVYNTFERGMAVTLHLQMLSGGVWCLSVSISESDSQAGYLSL
jgi:hypothetical protein